MGLQVGGGSGGGGGSTPTGTGFTHNTAGVQDAAARAVNLGTTDVTGKLPLASVGAPSGDDAFDWNSATNYPSISRLKTLDTTNATQATLFSRTQDDESFTDYSVTVIGRGADGQHYRIDLHAAYARNDGSTTLVNIRPVTPSNEFKSTGCTWSATLDTSGADVRVRVTGQASLNVRWTCIFNAQIAKLDATIPSFTPETLNWGLLLKSGNYSLSGGTGTWTGTASAGSSSGRNMSDAAAPPDAVSGNPDFIAANSDYLNSTFPLSDVTTTGAGTVVAIFRADLATAPAAGPADSAGIFCDASAGRIGFAFTTSGLTAFMTDGSYKSITVATSTGVWVFAAMRWDGTNLKLRKNATDETPVLCGALASAANNPRLGRNYAAVAFDGTMRFFGISPVAFTDQNLTDLYNWAVAQGLLT